MKNDLCQVQRHWGSGIKVSRLPPCNISSPSSFPSRYGILRRDALGRCCVVGETRLECPRRGPHCDSNLFARVLWVALMMKLNLIEVQSDQGVTYYSVYRFVISAFV